MPQAGYRKIFLNEQNLYLLLNYRIEGYTLRSLAALFHCDKNAVRSQMDKYYRAFPQMGTISFLLDMRSALSQEIKQRGTVEIIGGERVNVGKASYKDYLLCSPPKSKHFVS